MRLKKRFSIQILMVLILSMYSGLLTTSVFADPISSIHLNTKSVNESEIVPGKVIVKYKSMRYAINSFGLQSISPKVYTLSFSNEMSVTAKINELQKDPNVEYAEPVYRVHFADASIQRSVTSSIYSNFDTSYMHNWGKNVTGLTYASTITNETNNSHVVVAVIDSGVDLNHPDLIGSIVQGYNFVNQTAIALDDNGHGTNVAGIIAAKSTDISNATHYTGVAPLTKIMPIKVMDSLGYGETAALVAGIRFAIDSHNPNNSSYPVNIINLSLGSMLPSKAVHDVIKEAVNAGILVVAAAGNDSNHWKSNETGDFDSLLSTNSHRYAFDASYPAAFDEVISVGAVEQLDNSQLTIADFSNINKVDVVAPGVNIYSTYKGGLYKSISGTSQATPFVAGFAALLKGYNQNLTVDDIRSIIRSSANGPLMPPGNQSNYDPAINDLVTDEMLYGNGLINAKAAFELPRLVIKKVQGNLAQSRTVSFDVYAKNLLNQTLNLNDQVQIHFSVWHDESSVRSGDMTAYTTTATNLNNGYVRLSFDVPSVFPTDTYHYYFYADWINQSPAVLQKKSNYIDFISRPLAPTSSLQGGAYSGTQTVSLLKGNQDVNTSIYYLLFGTHTFKAGLYTIPLVITEDSTLNIFTLKNHVVSDENEYSYHIIPIPTAIPSNGGGGSGGGGGGGGFFIPPGAVTAPSDTASPTPSPLPSAKPSENIVTIDQGGKITLEIKTNKDYMIDLLNKPTSEIIVDAKSTQTVNTFSVELDGDVMLKAKEKGKSIIIQSNDLQIHLASDTLNLQGSKANVKFSATVAKDQTLPTNIQSVSAIYDFNLSIDNKDTHTFNKPIEVHFSIDPAKVHNSKNLGVFYYNDLNQQWEYVGGTVNKDNTVTALLPHFSKYAVLESTKTFNDIQAHWAKADIEEMAAKQIINGMTETTFQPDSSITRAQFVSLLSRSLKLEKTPTDHSFSDVPASAWYAADVYAAYHARIVNGKSDQVFAPDDKITREQLATLLVNAYLTATGKKISDIVTTQELKYTDEGSVSSWARSNVRIATSLGFMSGVGNGVFNPAGYATRAEAAVVLKRFLNHVN